MTPIFPGYVFACLDRTDRQRLWQTGHIARMIDVVDQKKLLDELHDIRIVERSGSFLHPVSSITRGKRVRIIDGPLYGFEGRVKRIKGKSCVVLEVDIIHQRVACEIDAGMVVPV
jgi:transcription antitermination factor NusG